MNLQIVTSCLVSALFKGYEPLGEPKRVDPSLTREGIHLTLPLLKVGLNLGKIDTNGVRLNFWDLGGQEELQALWDKYYQATPAP